MDYNEQTAWIDGFLKFINHNISAGYITSDTKVSEVIFFLKNIKNQYLPMVKQIQDNLEKQDEKEFKNHLKWFMSSGLFTQEEKDGMNDRINRYVNRIANKYDTTKE